MDTFLWLLPFLCILIIQGLLWLEIANDNKPKGPCKKGEYTFPDDV